jgi:YfiH family protein
LKLVNKKGVYFYQFSNLAKFSGIQHGIFTRREGFSKEPFKSLNVTSGIGDDEKNVHQNRRIISRCIEGAQLVFAEQVHGDNVLIIDHNGKGEDHKNPAAPLVGDAMVTSLHQKFLTIQVADCQSVMMYESHRDVVANVHVGWRGSIKNIIARTLAVMESHFGCRADRITAGIGPSLGPCCAEFVNYQTEIPEKFWKYKNAYRHFDFWALSHDQLLAAGVLGENISKSMLCTKCHSDLFFSYRREGTTGRFAAVIGLK